MRLEELLAGVWLKETVGDPGVLIEDITADSRRVRTGTLFVALRGRNADGHAFVESAASRGAAAMLVERRVDVPVPQVIVPDTRRLVALLAHRLRGFPGEQLTVVGVTGTNGKTTAATWIEQILLRAGLDTGLIGTLEQRTLRGKLDISDRTTPMAVDLAQALDTMLSQGCTHVVMEAASIALVQARTAGIRFRVAAFTNLTQDHLDDHGTMEAYGAAKGLLFSRLGNDYLPCADGGLPVAVLNADDPWSERYATDTVQQVIRYGIERPADVRASRVTVGLQGARFRLETFAGSADVSLRVTGRFNVYNALCAAAAGLALGVDFGQILESLADFPGVPGRLERVEAGQPYTIFVDYSHTPDSLENALALVRELAAGRVIAVVGCGGDRDPTKRPKMARIAVDLADLAILTSDNPRTEDPEKILDDMEEGLTDHADKAYRRIVSREEAIRTALAQARAGDVVLIAGKGHETYQIIGKTYHDFDDRVVAAQIVRGER